MATKPCCIFIMNSITHNDCPPKEISKIWILLVSDLLATLRTWALQKAVTCASSDGLCFMNELVFWNKYYLSSIFNNFF